MNRIKKKLRSRDGASITFALLLFLVCAVLCSVVLTAASTVSGRMSRIAESDQRYYAVTSAAELLKDVLDGQTVSFVKVVETPYTTTYTNGASGEPVKGTSATKYFIFDKTANEIEEADFADDKEVKPDEFKPKSFVNDAAFNVCYKSAAAERNLTLSASEVLKSKTIESDALTVTLEEKVNTGGDITFIIYNAYDNNGNTSESGSRYQLQLTFLADKAETSETKTENVSQEPIDEDTFQVKTKTTTTTITTLSWHLDEIKTQIDEAAD